MGFNSGLKVLIWTHFYPERHTTLFPYAVSMVLLDFIFTVNIVGVYLTLNLSLYFQYLFAFLSVTTAVTNEIHTSPQATQK
jgi:hypothetical protein